MTIIVNILLIYKKSSEFINKDSCKVNKTFFDNQVYTFDKIIITIYFTLLLFRFKVEIYNIDQKYILREQKSTIITKV